MIKTKFARLLLVVALFGFNAVTRAEPISAPLKHEGLQAALVAMVKHHPAIKGMRAELAAQGFAVDGAKAGRYPTFSAQANNLDDNINRGTLRLKQPLWAFGKINTFIKQSEALLTSEQLRLLQIQRQLIEEVSVAYGRIEGIRRREQVAKNNIAEHELLHQRIKRREEGQLATAADVNLAYSRLMTARAELQVTHGEFQVALNDLEALTQVAVATDTKVDRNLVDLGQIRDLETLALKTNADVKIKREQVNILRLDTKAEKVAALPTLYFQVEHDLSETLSNVDRTRVGFVIEGDVGYGVFARVKGAEARMGAAEQDLNYAISDVKQRVRTLMINRKVQSGLKKSQLLVVMALQDTLASFVRQYETGRKSWVEVLNTQRELTQQFMRLEQIENDWLVLSLRLLTITGGLDSQSGIESL